MKFRSTGLKGHLKKKDKNQIKILELSYENMAFISRLKKLCKYMQQKPAKSICTFAPTLINNTPTSLRAL